MKYVRSKESKDIHCLLGSSYVVCLAWWRTHYSIGTLYRRRIESRILISSWFESLPYYSLVQAVMGRLAVFFRYLHDWWLAFYNFAIKSKRQKCKRKCINLNRKPFTDFFLIKQRFKMKNVKINLEEKHLLQPH